MLKAGWAAHILNAPENSSSPYPATTRPSRHALTFSPTRRLPIPPPITRTATPAWTRESRGAIIAADETRANTAESPAHDIPPAETGYFADASAAPTADEALWLALCIAPAEETDVGELLRLTAMSRPTLYRRLADHAKAGAPSRSAAAAGAVTTEMPPR